jgi:hypothetical protein
MEWKPTAWVESRVSSDLISCGVDAYGEHVTVCIGPCPVYAYIVSPERLDDADLQALSGRVQWAANNALRNRSHFAEKPVQCSALDAKSIYGYTAATSQFIRITAPTSYALSDALKAMTDWGSVHPPWIGRPVQTFEGCVTSLTRFLHAIGSSPHHTLHIDGGGLGRVKPEDVRVASSAGSWSLRVASFDIEVMSEDGHSFPSATRDGDFVAQIGVLMREPGAERAVIFVCQPTADVPGVEVRQSITEHAMLVDFIAWIYSADMDCLVGYNIFGFDWAYILDRMERKGITDKLLAPMNCPKWRTPRRVKRTLQSAAFGCNEHVYLDIPGIVQVDLLVYLRREMKLESYKLDDVAYELTKERKINLPPAQIFSKLASGSDTERAEVAVYCIQDCRLVADIVDSRDVLLGLFETANVCGVQCSDILGRGMQIRSYVQILREATPLGYLIPDMRSDGASDEHYEGATVLHAEPGIYYDAVSGLDFNSLYPSIMIANNMCYSTLLAELDDVPHFEATSDDGSVVARFSSETTGVLPSLLRKLWSGRKETKKQMAAESDPMRKKLLNAKQLAQKVGMNSIYGLTGATKGMLPCVRIAAAITAQGRSMLKRSKEFVEANFPCRVVYGDSVAADTLVTVYEEGVPRTLDVAALHAEFAGMSGSVSVATHAGHGEVLSVVAHETEKRMFRVTLANGAYVDVTEDHSLISDTRDPVAPTELVVGVTRIMVVA